MDKNHLNTMLDLSGRTEALRLAFVVLIKMQPIEFQRQFVASYQNEVIAWRELASSTPNPDNWIDSFESHANRLAQLIEK
jgi:hypothetical protein